MQLVIYVPLRVILIDIDVRFNTCSLWVAAKNGFRNHLQKICS